MPRAPKEQDARSQEAGQRAIAVIVSPGREVQAGREKGFPHQPPGFLTLGKGYRRVRGGRGGPCAVRHAGLGQGVLWGASAWLSWRGRARRRKILLGTLTVFHLGERCRAWAA